MAWIEPSLKVENKLARGVSFGGGAAPAAQSSHSHSREAAQAAKAKADMDEKVLAQLERDPLTSLDKKTAKQLWALRSEPSLYPRSGLLPKVRATPPLPSPYLSARLGRLLTAMPMLQSQRACTV
jgi:hypothetical protein